jgi:hypothetical protein
MKRAVVAGSVALVALAVLTPPARPVNQKAVDRAIDRGVEYLRSLQRQDGTWPHIQIGMTALAGLTLLECGVPPDDSAVQRAAEAVRDECIGVTATYSLSLGIIFLDRLGDPRDEDLIQSMAVRLLAGQNSNGGWTYTCPEIDETQVRRLRGLFDQQAELVARGKGARDVKNARDVPAGRRAALDVRTEIQKEVARLRNRLARDGHGDGHHGFVADNSNTQFATLALWVARRHGVPIDDAVSHLNQRFRGSQNEDGGWGYQSGSIRVDPTTATMTCAGLLGLAVAFGTANENLLRTQQAHASGPAGRPVHDPALDLAVRRGLVAVSRAIGTPSSGRFGGHGGMRWSHQGRGFYFLWSLERVAVAYGLNTICNKDWYAWGADVLLANQEDDGSWLGGYAKGGADTCFALLFLRRSNLAKDLTSSLNGKVKDPGESVLRAKGVGADSKAPGLNANDRVSGNEPGLRGGSAAERPVRSDAARPAPRRSVPTPSVSRPAAPLAPASPRPEPRAPESEADQLRNEFLRQPGAVQEQMLVRLRDGKGPAYTQALAEAIPKLGPTMQKKARAVLAERMTRMTSDTLGDKLRNEQAEIRRAAARAIAMKEDRDHLPRLIDLLEDPDPSVARTAHVALKSLTGKDLGPAPGADSAERAAAAAAWKVWLKKQSGK